MSADIERYLGLLDRNVGLFRALARELIECRKEFVTMDLDGMYNRISQQERICREIQSLHSEIIALQNACAKLKDSRDPGRTFTQERPQWAERLHKVTRKLGDAQAEVGRLTQIQAAYLRRARRTNQMLMNSLANYIVTYARPAEPILAAQQSLGRG